VNKVLLDTDIVSEIFRQKNQTLIAKATAYRAIIGYYTISMITIMEVVQGWHRVQKETMINNFLNSLTSEEVLFMGLNESELSGRIYADLERTGQRIGYPDCMIASIAICHQLSLVTGNFAHYQRIANLGYSLVLKNWKV
jgi:predicted nucleic acid-binding protein